MRKTEGQITDVKMGYKSVLTLRLIHPSSLRAHYMSFPHSKTAGYTPAVDLGSAFFSLTTELLVKWLFHCSMK